MKKRETWADIAKAIGILGVVLGHAGVPSIAKYMYWFHMPFFFLMSGYFFKPLSSWKQFPAWGWKKTKQLLIPYICFFMFIMMIRMIFHPPPGGITIYTIKQELLSMLYGGKILRSYYGVFWFITTLYLTQMIFQCFHLSMKKPKQIIAISIGCYLLAHLISVYFYQMKKDIISIPWNADVTFIAIFYFMIGFYMKRYIQRLRNSKLQQWAIFTLAGSLILMDINGWISYGLNLKNSNYQHFLLDILIPLVFSFVVIILAIWMEKIPTLIREWFEKIGQESLVIMYLHIPVNMVLEQYFVYDIYDFAFFGILIPMLLSIHILSKTVTTRLLFLGKA
jgi:fucose 4-O-acetylase-like acetyltransferase